MANFNMIDTNGLLQAKFTASSPDRARKTPALHGASSSLDRTGPLFEPFFAGMSHGAPCGPRQACPRLSNSTAALCAIKAFG